MARGWESKAVEAQMETSQSKPAEPAKRQMTVEAAALLRKKETLLLAQSHLHRQLEAAQHERHRTMLQQALADLDKQLTDLDVRARTAGA